MQLVQQRWPRQRRQLLQLLLVLLLLWLLLRLLLRGRRRERAQMGGVREEGKMLWGAKRKIAVR